MKHFYIKQLFTLLLLLCSTVANAYDFISDGIYYTRLSDTEVCVTYGNTPYSGKLIIPESVTNSSETGVFYTVTAIGEQAFANSTGLTGITIPKTVTIVNNGSFNGCTGLTEVVIEDSTEPLYLGHHSRGTAPHIGYGLFYDCPLESVHQGRTVTYNESYESGYSPFAYKSTIKSFTYGKEVTAINYCALYRCDGIETLTIPDKVECIAQQAFSGCSSLKGDLIIPSGVESIGIWAFKDCSNLTGIILPDSITRIEEATFDGCLSLESLVIPEGVTFIGGFAFNHCESLKSMRIASSVTQIANCAFDYCTSLKHLYFADGEEILTLGSGHNGSNFTRGAFDFSPLESIYLGRNITHPTNAEPFYNKAQITDLTIGESVTSLPYCCFTNCAGITTITIPSSITEIGASAFYGCKNLMEVHITDLEAWCSINFMTADSNPLVCGKNLYLNGEAVTELNIPNGVTAISNYAFYGCPNLTSVNIPGCVESIGDYAFYNCNNIASLEILDGVKRIGNYAFYYCYNIPSLEIPNSVDTIGDYTFHNCNGIKSLTIGEGVTEIGKEAFSYCTALTGELVIPDSTTRIGSMAFYKCSNITSLTLGENITDIEDSAFSRCTNLAGRLVVPNSTKYVGAYAFEFSSLTDVVIGDNVTVIGYGAFQYSGYIKNVTLPDGLTTLNGCVFRDCSSITSIAIPASVTTIGSNTFDYCRNLKDVYITDLTAWCNIDFHNGSANPLCNNGNLYLSGEPVIDLVIPDGITELKQYAFYGTNNIRTITLPSSIQKLAIFHIFSGQNQVFYFASNPQTHANSLDRTSVCHLILTDSEGVDFDPSTPNTFADVSYTRTMDAGRYGTIMLPFAPDSASCANYAFYTLKESNEGFMRFEEEDAPTANTPYLYTLREGAENTPIAAGRTTITADINTVSADGWEFIGAYKNQTIDCTQGYYYAFSSANTEINHVTNSLKVRPYRAYFKGIDAQNSSMRIVLEGTTGIKEISLEQIEGIGEENVTLYDLTGRRVMNPVKGGLYIKNGKKIIL